MSKQHYTTETYTVRSSVGHLMKRAHGLLMDYLAVTIARADLTFTQWIILMYLRDGLAINASDLCSQIRHDSGALTRVLDQLEARGLVLRERSREDRRAVQLRLTEAGHALLEQLAPGVVERINGAFASFSPTELQELERLLRKLITALEHDAHEATAAPAAAAVS